MRTVKYLAQHMAHHASASGYDQLAHVRDGEYLPVSDSYSLLERAQLRLQRQRIQNCGNQWYNRASMYTERLVMQRARSEKNEVVHFLYGENSFRFAGEDRKQAKTNNNLLVATYHTPAHRLEQLLLKPDHLSTLDAVVIMSDVQRPFFEQFLPANAIHFVPHGINTDYFCPATSEQLAEARAKRTGFQCITVGHHLRDYETLAKVATRASADNLDVHFMVVAWPDRVGPVANLPNVTCLTGITDEQLLNYYQTSDLLMLPLLDATANNTLLEGMACGLPVLSTRLQGVLDYAPEQVLLTDKDDADTAFELLRDAMTNKTDLQTLADSSRARATELSWASVRAQLEPIYQST